MLEQTKNAAHKLKKAGLKRSEFSCRVKRQYVGKNPNTGKPAYEYGNVDITLKCPYARQYEVLENLAKAGLHVTVYCYIDDKGNIVYSYPTIDNEYKKQGIIEIYYCATGAIKKDTISYKDQIS